MTQKFNRVLVVKLADIGDAVLSLPAVQSLRTELPHATIDVLTTEAGANVFRLSPAIDDVIVLAKRQFDQAVGLIAPKGLLDLTRLAIRLRSGRYDAVVILHHLTTSFGTRKFYALAKATGAPVIAGLDNSRGRFLTHRATDFGFGAIPEWEYGLKVIESLGITATKSAPEISVSDYDRRSAARLVERTIGLEQPYAVLHAEVGDFSPARAWRDDYFADVARHLTLSHSLPILSVGVETDRPGRAMLKNVDGVHDLVGRTSFPELCEIVRNAAIVIGCDSSVCHLAGAFGRPTIALFGPTNFEAWKPFGAEIVSEDTLTSTPGSAVIALHRDMPCSPCMYTGFRLGRPQGCRSRTCMMGLTPEPVTRIATSLLNARG